MGALIRQIAQNFKETLRIDETEAVEKALQTAAFSGLDRSGFFRDYVYLPDLDHRVGKKSYICFLHTGSGQAFDPDPFYPCICDELNSMGVKTPPEKKKYGFKLIISDDENSDPISLELFVYHKEMKGIERKISYIQCPLPYEIRSLEGLKGTLRSEIQKAFEKCVKAETAAKKKDSKKTRRAAKKAESTQEQWVQPSLF